MVHVCDFRHHIPNGRWVADWRRECPNYADANALMRTYRPRLQMSLRPRRIDEMTYRQMAQAIDPNFLKQGIRAAALRGVRFDGFDGDTMIFYVTSSEIEINGIEYLNLVKFMNWDEYGNDPDLTPREKALHLLWLGDIQVHCDDPSFLYWGYQYILTQLDASVYEEPRYPEIRNPELRGIVCKHLNRVIRALPFYNGDIAKEIVAQWGGKLDKKAAQEIQERETLQQQVNALPPDQVEPEPEPQPFELPNSLENEENPAEPRAGGVQPAAPATPINPVIPTSSERARRSDFGPNPGLSPKP